MKEARGNKSNFSFLFCKVSNTFPQSQIIFSFKNSLVLKRSELYQQGSLWKHWLRFPQTTYFSEPFMKTVWVWVRWSFHHWDERARGITDSMGCLRNQSVSKHSHRQRESSMALLAHRLQKAETTFKAFNPNKKIYHFNLKNFWILGFEGRGNFSRTEDNDWIIVKRILNI